MRIPEVCESSGVLALEFEGISRARPSRPWACRKTDDRSAGRLSGWARWRPRRARCLFLPARPAGPSIRRRSYSFPPRRLRGDSAESFTACGASRLPTHGGERGAAFFEVVGECPT